MSCGGLLAGAAYAFLDRRLQTDGVQRHLDEYIFISSLFAIGLILFRRWDRAASELRWLQPLAACGRISYSIYLTHFLLVVVMSSLFAAAGFRADAHVAALVVPCCLLLSIPPAYLFHHAVEKRFMNSPSIGTKTANASQGSLARARISLVAEAT
ncbi:acyltransferase family protein [bacterium]|nr:acyltransferase family protein [bacterium]